MHGRRGVVLGVAALVIGVVLLWGAVDLWGPWRVDIRSFRPNDVARLDADMWRSYYDRRPLVMFGQLADLLRRQFHFPPLRSYVVAARAARAAFVFKGGHGRTDYERALPDLVRYFQAIRAISTTPFDEELAARLELEWWIVHREREGLPDAALQHALAQAAAALYRVPADYLVEYARGRALAMDLRDSKAAVGGLSEGDWRRIERTLRGSWQALWKAVQPVPGPR